MKKDESLTIICERGRISSVSATGELFLEKLSNKCVAIAITTKEGTTVVEISVDSNNDLRYITYEL